MSDLISRKKLIESIKKFDFGSFFIATEKEYIESTIIYIINLQPTAYDIDKVVEELGQKKEEVQRMRNTCIALSDLEVCDIENVTYERAVEIVKHGGVSDDVCECRLLNGHQFLHETSCGEVFDIQNGFKYCPFCGKKIKVVE